MTTPYARIMREKRALIWPILAALVINIALFALVVYPLSQKVATGEQDATAAADALTAAKKQYQSARDTVAGKSQADEELKRFYENILPPDVAGARRISYLRVVQLAQQMNLRFETQTATPSEVRESNLGKWTQIAVLTGNYRDIRRFIHQLETAPEFLVMERVDLKQNENETSKGITVTVQLATYFRAASDGN